MCAGNFEAPTVRTHKLIGGVCAVLSTAGFESLEFSNGDLHLLHSCFGAAGEVWCNRHTNDSWRVGTVTLGPYGYLAKTSGGLTSASVLTEDGRHLRYSVSPQEVFVAAPDHERVLAFEMGEIGLSGRRVLGVRPIGWEKGEAQWQEKDSRVSIAVRPKDFGFLIDVGR